MANEEKFGKINLKIVKKRPKNKGAKAPEILPEILNGLKINYTVECRIDIHLLHSPGCPVSIGTGGCCPQP